MTAKTGRQILRRLHMLLSVPVVRYIYGPVAQIPPAANAVRFVFFPLIVLTGLWMWKGGAMLVWLRNLGGLS